MSILPKFERSGGGTTVMLNWNVGLQDNIYGLKYWPKRSARGIWYGQARRSSSFTTLNRLRYMIISSRKKLYLSTLISRTIGWNPPNHTLVISAADELNLHLLFIIRSGNSAGLQERLHRSFDSLCFVFIWKTSTGSAQFIKWLSWTLSMTPFIVQLLS